MSFFTNTARGSSSGSSFFTRPSEAPHFEIKELEESKMQLHIDVQASEQPSEGSSTKRVGEDVPVGADQDNRKRVRFAETVEDNNKEDRDLSPESLKKSRTVFPPKELLAALETESSEMDEVEQNEGMVYVDTLI
jgi:hypothetical protein